MVAAEPSGDQLGAALIRALRGHFGHAEFEGVGGEAMEAEGLVSRIPMDRLGVMGLVEVLVHLPALLRERRRLCSHWLEYPPDVFIGVDAPDFNLGLARQLRGSGVPTVQYVSPTVWAWRQSRVATLRQSVDLVLSIYPFEKTFLEQREIDVEYVGHPLADRIPLEVDRAAARAALDLPADDPVIAVLPGSRRSEMNLLAEPFLASAAWCHRRNKAIRLVTPLVGDTVAEIFHDTRRRVAPELPIRTVRGRSQEVLTAADVVLAASGTATLEAMLCKRPMIVGYRVHWLTYFLARHLRLVKTRWVAMANILAGEELAPEFLQGRCDASHLAPALLDLLEDRGRRAVIEARYRELHERLRCNAGESAAEAVAKLVARARG